MRVVPELRWARRRHAKPQAIGLRIPRRSWWRRLPWRRLGSSWFWRYKRQLVMAVLSVALLVVYWYLTRTDPAPADRTFTVDADNAPLSILIANLDLSSADQAKVDLHAEAACRGQRQVAFYVETSVEALLSADSIESAPSRLRQTERCRNGTAQLTVIAHMKRDQIISRLAPGRESFDIGFFGFPLGAQVQAHVETALFNRFETLYGAGQAVGSPLIAQWDGQDGVTVAGVIGQPDAQARADRLIDLLLLVSGAVLGLALSGRPRERTVNTRGVNTRGLPHRRTGLHPRTLPRPPRWARESRKSPDTDSRRRKRD